MVCGNSDVNPSHQCLSGLWISQHGSHGLWNGLQTVCAPPHAEGFVRFAKVVTVVDEVVLMEVMLVVVVVTVAIMAISPICWEHYFVIEVGWEPN